MDPVGHPAEAVPLQGKYDWPPGQPEGATVVQHTVVNISPEPPKDYIVWSLCCLLYANPCCLGLAAFIFSIKARDRKVVGDLDGARHYGATARCLNIWATVVFSLLFLIAIIAVIVIVVRIEQARRSIYRFDYDFRWNH